MDDRQSEQGELLPSPVTIYYPTSLLTLRPQPLAEADLDPPSIHSLVASGKVTLIVWIDQRGATSKVAVERSNLPQRIVDVAVAAFVRLPFTPGELHGQKVGAVMKVEITYDDGRIISKEVVH